MVKVYVTREGDEESRMFLGEFHPADLDDLLDAIRKYPIELRREGETEFVYSHSWDRETWGTFVLTQEDGCSPHGEFRIAIVERPDASSSCGETERDEEGK